MSIEPRTTVIIDSSENFTPHYVHRIVRHGKSRYSWTEWFDAVKINFAEARKRQRDGDLWDRENE